MQPLDRVVCSEQALFEHWEATPLVSRSLGDLSDVLSVDSIAGLLHGKGLRTPLIRMLKDGETIPDSEFSSSIGQGSGSLAGLVDGARVLEHIQAGATLVLQGLALFAPPVAQLCDELSHAIGHQVHANAYLTPPNSRGAGAHFDPHSVIIRQVTGEKVWRVGPRRSLPGPRKAQGSGSRRAGFRDSPSRRRLLVFATRLLPRRMDPGAALAARNRQHGRPAAVDVFAVGLLTNAR